MVMWTVLTIIARGWTEEPSTVQYQEVEMLKVTLAAMDMRRWT